MYTLFIGKANHWRIEGISIELAVEENWHLKGCTLCVKNDIYFCNISTDESICELE